MLFLAREDVWVDYNEGLQCWILQALRSSIKDEACVGPRLVVTGPEATLMGRSSKMLNVPCNEMAMAEKRLADGDLRQKHQVRLCPS
jgi:hypothetical protein